ncbi:MAG: MBL fold metallo-hydrolase, partial [Planctomycetota bacterium]
MIDRSPLSFRDRLAKLRHRLLVGISRLLSWRTSADAAKRKPGVLLIADKLGREVGRARALDFVRPLRKTKSPDLSRLLASDLGCCWIGHATMLLRVGGKTILTDPVFHPRVGLGYVLGTIGPRRFQAPAMSIEQLPPLDAIVVSHAHFDHLDRPSLWKLSRTMPEVPVITSRGVRDLLDDLRFRDVREVDWHEETSIGELRLTALPVVHWGPRVFYDDWRSYSAFRLACRGQRVIFGADTAETDTFQSAGPVDLMCVGIGAYDPYVQAHATPEQAWRMTRDAGAKHVAAMHHSTFKLSHEPMDEPLRRLLAAAGEEAGRIVVR